MWDLVPQPGVEPGPFNWEREVLALDHQGSPSHKFYVVFCFGLPWWLRWERICLHCRRLGFNPWVGKIPWRRTWLSTPVFLPGESHGQRSLAGYSPWGCRVRYDWATDMHAYSAFWTLRGVVPLILFYLVCPLVSFIFLRCLETSCNTSSLTEITSVLTRWIRTPQTGKLAHGGGVGCHSPGRGHLAEVEFPAVCSPERDTPLLVCVFCLVFLHIGRCIGSLRGTGLPIFHLLLYVRIPVAPYLGFILPEFKTFSLSDPYESVLLLV